MPAVSVPVVMSSTPSATDRRSPVRAFARAFSKDWSVTGRWANSNPPAGGVASDIAGRRDRTAKNVWVRPESWLVGRART